MTIDLSWELHDAASDAAAQAALDEAAKALRRTAETVRRRHRNDPRGALHAYAELLSAACGVDPTTGARRHTTIDVLGWIARAVAMGCERPSIGPTAIDRVHRMLLVPNATLRGRFEILAANEELHARELAVRIGAIRRLEGGAVGDATRVERMLGIRPTPGSRGSKPFLRLFVSYEQAVLLASALGVPYHQLGV